MNRVLLRREMVMCNLPAGFGAGVDGVSGRYQAVSQFRLSCRNVYSPFKHLGLLLLQ